MLVKGRGVLGCGGRLRVRHRQEGKILTQKTEECSVYGPCLFVYAYVHLCVSVVGCCWNAASDVVGQVGGFWSLLNRK